MFNCAESEHNFLIDDFPKILSNAIDDKTEIENFKNVPFDSAVMYYKNFPSIFPEATNIISDDTIFVTRFKNSMEKNNLSTFDLENSHLLAAIYHKKLNNEKIEISSLKQYIHPKYVKKNILSRSKKYVDSNPTDCNIKRLSALIEFIERSPEKINLIDAEVILRSTKPLCKSNVEYLELYNETLYKFFENKPELIIELLEEGSYHTVIFEIIEYNLANPIHDGIDLNLVVNNVNSLNESKIRNRLLGAVEMAISKLGGAYR